MGAIPRRPKVDYDIWVKPGIQNRQITTKIFRLQVKYLYS